MTNYELIKNMSIEEMAITLMCPTEMGMAEIECHHEDWRNCSQCCLEWLKQEVTDEERKCRICGCTQNNACEGGCYWVEYNLCSKCAEKLEMENTTQEKILSGIVAERKRQVLIWGQENHAPHFWTGILGEEYGEFCEAINETVFESGSDKGGYENIKREAIHVGAVAVSFLECLERNKRKWFKKE